LVGDRWEIGYDKWIKALAADLGLGDNVTLTGKVSQQDLVTYYRTADCYVSMSEHEGFGLPLLESMYCSLPVFAYATTGIPYTMGHAGIQFFRKDYEALAELVQLLLDDPDLRRRVVAGQKERVQNFLEPSVRAQFEDILSRTGII
jgi:glycosyltransferase involved in cell wall biosynthesis